MAGTDPLAANIIPESVFYRLIVGSNMPEAERFEDWVFEEVIAQICKTGSCKAPVLKILDAPKSGLLRLAYEQQV